MSTPVPPSASAVRRAPSLAIVGLALVVTGCGDDRLYDQRGMASGYRSGTEEDDYLSNGERGNVEITEVLWAGSVESVGDGWVHHPDDVFIELRNKHPRPVHLTGWQLTVETTKGASDEEDRHFATYIIPPRDTGAPVEVNEFVVVARSRDGAFPDADYVIPELRLPRDHFQIVLRDLDNRLMGDAGNAHEDVPAGAWDLVSVRSMERVQLIFSNDGGRNSSWHSYSLNEWDGVRHSALQSRIAPAYRARTYASPGRPNSPDYSGNTAAGSFE